MSKGSSTALVWALACVLVLVLSAGCASDHGPPDASRVSRSAVDFDRDVRPILSTHCFSCHGPDASGRQASLRLDLSSDVFALRKNGQPVVVKGDAAASLLYQRITSPDNPMPPETAHLPLTSHEVEVIRRWIDAGAEYPDRWFLIAPSRPTPPAISHESWVRNPIDAFVAKKLEELKLEPAPEADPRALVRRVTYALTGLPPTPEEVAAFVADPSDAAYGALVDRLLAAPAYGEQRAHYWLDAARYGDTHGYHMDDYRSAWPYRDYVIDAFNAGMSFDQFTVEQLAGDLLPSATLDQKVATGFIRAAMSTSEGGSFEDEYAAIYAKDRVDALGKTWLGLTVACAACHDHKFDPVSQAEFYALTAYFRNSTQPVLDLNAADAPPSVLVGDTPSLVTEEAGTEPSAFVLERGQYDHPGRRVAAGVPAALPPLPAGVPNNRLGLARWLLLPEHPLTARVTANRFWSEIFGVGLVRTAHDFGSTGEAPSHPELLDWLAAEFVRPEWKPERAHTWDVNHLVRTIVTSETYK
ncbi:MAG TPA: PSD1 and planctomycete cytochrome C domain-containing protein, partial [Polyangiaceae bacterium]|nr:PSD1 and planctomycete cytochrome C domain-containing protein [Polyangiaceae bacterium]